MLDETELIGSSNISSYLVYESKDKRVFEWLNAAPNTRLVFRQIAS